MVRFFPAAGFRYSEGKSTSRNLEALYWSSSANTEDRGWFLRITKSAIEPGNWYRTIGKSVRCVALGGVVTTAVLTVLHFVIFVLLLAK